MTHSPQDLQEFLFDFVENVEDLRVLSWFRQRGAGGVATESEVAGAIGVEDFTVCEVLERLVSKAVLERSASTPPVFRYAPSDLEFSVTLDAVLERYGESPMDILRIMSANAIERLRRAALRTFAESLRGRGPRRG